MTPDERYDFLWNQINMVDYYTSFVSDFTLVHASEMNREKLYDELKELVESQEYKEYTSY